VIKKWVKHWIQDDEEEVEEEKGAKAKAETNNPEMDVAKPEVTPLEIVKPAAEEVKPKENGSNTDLASGNVSLPSEILMKL